MDRLLRFYCLYRILSILNRRSMVGYGNMEETQFALRGRITILDILSFPLWINDT